jgi:predicted DsbA family dithiol-disulfide isomerase
VTWLPFDLHPEYPVEGIARAQLYARYGDGHVERLRDAFGALGLVYNPPPEVVPNTMRALRLTELARASDLHQPFHDRLMLAYWEEATDIGDPNQLKALAAEVGLDDGEVARVLEGDDLRNIVLNSTAQAQSIGITGIPAFVLDRRQLVLGAQPRPVFERILATLGYAPAGDRSTLDSDGERQEDRAHERDRAEHRDQPQP